MPGKHCRTARFGAGSRDRRGLDQGGPRNRRIVLLRQAGRPLLPKGHQRQPGARQRRPLQSPLEPPEWLQVTPDPPQGGSFFCSASYADPKCADPLCRLVRRFRQDRPSASSYRRTGHYSLYCARLRVLRAASRTPPAGLRPRTSSPSKTASISFQDAPSSLAWRSET